MYESMGFKNVRTYIQSGNVVFQSTEIQANKLEKRISGEISKHFALNVAVLLREKTELERIVQQNPFTKDQEPPMDKLYFTFLMQEPSKEGLDKLAMAGSSPDKYSIIGKTIYLLCAGSYGNTKLSNTFFENKLKVTATTRNLKTLSELLRICDQLE
jgi:uncharacterized protein (DUF1697 family)